MTVSEQKQAQRRAGRTARRALSAQARAAANAALCANLWQLDAVQNAQTILLYAAFGSEADLSAFAEKAQAAAQCGVQLIVLRRPEEQGETAETILQRCRELL